MYTSSRTWNLLLFLLAVLILPASDSCLSQQVAPIKGAVRLYTLPKDFQRFDWVSKNKIEITLGNPHNRRLASSYIVNIKTGRQSKTTTYIIPTIDAAEVSKLKNQWGVGETANSLRFSLRHTFLLVAVRSDNWRDIQEPIDIYEMKNDRGKILHKTSIKIPLNTSLDSQAVELSPNGEYILWCFAQRTFSDASLSSTNSDQSSNGKLYTFWISRYNGENLRRVASIKASSDGECPENIVWYLDDKQISFAYKGAIWLTRW
jgi:hypothetical protein